MADRQFKVAVLGCGGIGRLISTVVRQAVHMIKQDRPEQVVVISSGSLTGDVAEALAAGRAYPLPVIDGCRPHCATAIAQRRTCSSPGPRTPPMSLPGVSCLWGRKQGRARREGHGRSQSHRRWGPREDRLVAGRRDGEHPLTGTGGACGQESLHSAVSGDQ